VNCHTEVNRFTLLFYKEYVKISLNHFTHWCELLHSLFLSFLTTLFTFFLPKTISGLIFYISLFKNLGIGCELQNFESYLDREICTLECDFLGLISNRKIVGLII